MRAVHKRSCPSRNYLFLFKKNHFTLFRLAGGQKRYSGVFMDGTAANNEPFALRSVFHWHQQIQQEK